MLKSKIKDERVKRILFVILFYGSVAALIFWFNKISLSGPCTPGLGMLLLLVLPFLSLLLGVINLIRGLWGDKASFVSAFFHLAIGAGMGYFLFSQIN